MPFHLFDRVAVEESGEGEVVFCVHGLGGSSNTFAALFPAFAGHRFVGIDLPGSGRSQRVEGALSIERFVDSVVDICARLKISRAHWVGHSMGTIVCQHLAVKRPALVRSLALFGPLLAPPEPARVALRARGQKAQGEGAAGMHDIAETLVKASLSADSRQHQPVVAAFVRENIMRQEGEAYGRNCLALADAQPAEVERIEVPVLLVTGDEDGVAPPQAVRSLAERMRKSASCKVVVLPRCGHWTPIERPQQCQRELRDFLAKAR